jgi:hypothetical protein
MFSTNTLGIGLFLQREFPDRSNNDKILQTGFSQELTDGSNRDCALETDLFKKNFYLNLVSPF